MCLSNRHSSFGEFGLTRKLKNLVACSGSALVFLHRPPKRFCLFTDALSLEISIIHNGLHRAIELGRIDSWSHRAAAPDTNSKPLYSLRKIIRIKPTRKNDLRDAGTINLC
jgi:hypothetical protein